MKIKYCLPIIKNKKSEVLKTIADNSQQYEYFEIWLDYIDDLDEGFIRNLQEQLESRLILLFRRKNLEPVHMNKNRRSEIIYLLDNTSVFLDLDITDQKEELDFVKHNNLKIKTIVSYHNYKKTPTDESLKEIIDTMKKYNPEILKIATKCNSQKDALRLLELLLAMKEKQVKSIVLGIGSEGLITRIFGSMWGNEMIFAPLIKDESSAEGQLTREEIETLFKILKQD